MLSSLWVTPHRMGFPGGSDSKESVCNAGDLGSIPGLERSPGERNGNPRQYSCLENSMGRGTWQATVHGVTKSWIQLSDTFTFSTICSWKILVVIGLGDGYVTTFTKWHKPSLVILVVIGLGDGYVTTFTKWHKPSLVSRHSGKKRISYSEEGGT